MASFYTNFFRSGEKVFIRRIDDGIPSLVKVPISPSIFIKSTDETGHKSLFGDNLQEINFSSVTELNSFVNSTDNVFGFNRFDYVEINKQFPEEEIEYDTSLLNIVAVDIETTVHKTNKFPDSLNPEEEILCISFARRGKRIQQFGIGAVTLRPEDKDTDYHQCADEKHLLNSFLEHWMSDYPDIVTGWNCEDFDFPYLYHRMQRVLGSKAANKLSPWGRVDIDMINNQEVRVDIKGITILDYMLMYKKFIFVRQKSYKLDYIAQQELGENKLHYDGTFQEFYENDYDKFVSYNIHDSRLIMKLDEKLQLIDLVASLAYFCKCNFIDTFMNTRLWDVIVANTLANRNIQVPFRVNNERSQFEGAFVKDTIAGKYDWAGSFDLTSLYPSILMQLNISPETILPAEHFIRLSPQDFMEETPLLKKALVVAKSLNAALAANGSMYSREKLGIFPELTDRLFKKRKEYKKIMQEYQKKEQAGHSVASLISKYNNLQMAAKILLNSLYGALGSPYFRHYNLHSAEGITFTGQVAIMTAQRTVNNALNKICGTDRDNVIAGDTDSGYFDFSNVVKKYKPNATNEQVVDFLDKLCAGPIADAIAKSYVHMADITNAYENKMDMKREAIGPGIFFGKKNYVMRVYDSEGVRYAKPKLKIVGHEAIESATSDYFEEKMKTMLDMLFDCTKQDIFEYEKKVREEYTSKDPSETAKIQQINTLNKHIGLNGEAMKGATAAAKGAILYNNELKRRGLDNKYPIIKEGDKIKTVSLKNPNPFGSNKLCFHESIPKELNDILLYIDNDTSYESSFLEPMERSLNVVGYSFKSKVTLEDLFG